MKNKKLLTRLFALLASLVLVLALALPCFADEVVTSQQYVLKTITFDNYSDFWAFFVLHVDYVYSIVFSEDGLILRPTFCSSGIAIFYSTIGDPVRHYYFYFAENVVALDQVSADGTITSQHFEGDALQALVSTLTIYYFDGLIVDDGGTDPTTPSSDMYSNLFNILKDAVYGSDAELTGSQEYALTLISTILTYATILLPVILVIFIAVWCFKRF